MAKFTSRFSELGFYVNGEHRKFHAGQFTTEKADEIKVLEQLVDTVRIDEPKEKAEEAPKPKAAPKKSSGK